MEPEEKPRAFGMAPGEAEKRHVKPPLWANPMAWGMLGAVLGAGIFVWSQRAGIEKAARGNLPKAQRQAQLAAKKLAVAAQGAKLIAGDLAKDAGMVDEPDPELPPGVTGADLSAPSDPTSLKRPVAKRKGPRRRTAAGDMPNAGGVQDVRARWDAPDVSYEAPVPWLETDMARGVKLTGGLAIFFGIFGYLMFSVTGSKPRSF
ncbi:MAG: hypothetical protein FD126_912 [Elusimicrobia bacterium]|nr:MAG: hypothetical protein FD126_912 [Elusimicrobiota bacterium]